MAFCEHHVYKPENDPVALSCQLCNPDGTGAGDAPVLPRSSSDPLNTNRTEKQETCNECGCIRTYSSTECPACGAVFALADGQGRVQGTANAHTPGSCPNCGSTVHYDAGKKWVCADCDTKFTPPKGKRT